MSRIKISRIEHGSIAEEMGIEQGDFLVNINGKPIADIFDYRYLISDEYIELLIEKPNGEQWELEIDKEENEDLGLVFESGLIDKSKSCSNKCVFCFIDQLPSNMRKSLYFKDDDSRLSFLQGNYVTLTNMKDSELERIIYYHLSPINISVHTTDTDLRYFMLKNINSKKIMQQIERLADAKIDMNFQIVLCKDINDKEHLDKTICDLSQFIPRAKSLSVVPVGISRYREGNGLHTLMPFDKQDALNVLEQIHTWQDKLKKQYGTSFVFAADEFYINAEQRIPEYNHYEDFPQLENGVGMIALMQKEFDDSIKKIKVKKLKKIITVVTGSAAYSFIRKLSAELTEHVKGLTINVVEIKNEFFGELITVSGLLTGRDIIRQLNGKQLGDVVLIPLNALRNSDTVFLDDITIEGIEKEIKTKVRAVECNGEKFISSILEDIE